MLTSYWNQWGEKTEFSWERRVTTVLQNSRKWKYFKRMERFYLPHWLEGSTQLLIWDRVEVNSAGGDQGSDQQHSFILFSLAQFSKGTKSRFILFVCLFCFYPGGGLKGCFFRYENNCEDEKQNNRNPEVS